ncbi:alpha-galactosidase [Bifidobacterium aerophilum]|uniref:alpha-galactosidase n=1 Tax=Bifidobacterium aerophilum TaxID=1798155 RepID=A0A6N9Z802_9BIFI|nr:alpha-galactosidase [Bifidobacterium aerophilum]NEG90484.1 alpha-galactosidase [Bifidobacterium aerophilum]
MPLIQQFQGIAADGTDLTAVYAEQSEANVAFALIFPGDGMPRFVHWGRPLADPGTVIGLYDALRPQRVTGGLDDTVWPSVLPTQAESWIGAPRFEVRRDGVELHCGFQVEAVTAAAVSRQTAPAATVPAERTGQSGHVTVGDQLANEPGPVPTVVVEAKDPEQGVGIVWTCELDESGLIRQRLEVANLGGGELEIGRIELGFPLPADASEILTTTGHHLRERHPQRQPLTVGRFEKLSMTGRPDFDASLLLSAGTPGFGFERGDVYSVHVGWSGNSVLSAERLPYTTGLLGGGEILLGGEVTLPSAGAVAASGDSSDDVTYTTPWVYGSYGHGLNEVAARFHDYLRRVHREFRDAIGVPDKPRPVILNTWEAVYFNQNYDTLTALADKAAAIGVERFVVDDGWFGSRRDDTSGLGDWQIAQDIWPDGPKSLRALADYVHGKGMEFGLWFEPEMANVESELMRDHPDWVLRPTSNRLPMQGRSQQVVDLTNPDAYDYVYGCMDRLVGELGIDYIKWDHNKLVTEAVSPRAGRPAVHAQTLAVYRIFRDLKTAHPGLEIESCSSGGGRVDLGILEVADRIWVSDCVDPLERVEIQRYTSLLVPPFMMGEHVGASPAHSTKRATSQELRMAMAFFGHMGVEWNLLKEPDEDVAKLGEWIAEFKKHREWFAVDTCVHTDAADPAVRVDGMVKPDKSAAFYRFTQVTTSDTYPAAPIRVPGLDPEGTYRIQPLWLDLDLDGLGIGNGQSPLGWWTEDGVLMSGAALAAYGLRPPSLHPAQSVLFTAIRQ